MSPGLVGLGLGGLFYIVSALLMLAREIGRAALRRPGPRRWRLVLHQASIAFVTIATVATGVAVVARLLPPPSRFSRVPTPGPEWMSWIIVPLGALALLLGVVTLAAVILPGRSRAPREDAPRVLPPPVATAASADRPAPRRRVRVPGNPFPGLPGPMDDPLTPAPLPDDLVRALE